MSLIMNNNLIVFLNEIVQNKGMRKRNNSISKIMLMILFLNIFWALLFQVQTILYKKFTRFILST